jgi:2-polyprenyl-6-methoxyphenol hydroxylase-like FAD-dependent oxidoreductase
MARLLVGALMLLMAAFGADVVVYGGSAAGVTAAIAARESGREVVQDVSYQELRRRLEERGAVISLQLAPRKD